MNGTDTIVPSQVKATTAISSGARAPRAPSARAEVNNPARFRAFERAAEQRSHGIVGTGQVLAELQKVGQRVAQRRRTGGEVVDLDEVQSHHGKGTFRAT